MIEQIVGGQFVYRSAWMPWAEIGFFVLTASFFVFLFSRFSPARIIPISLACAVSIPFCCAALFAWTGIMIDGLGMIAGLTIVASFALGTNLVDRDQDYHLTNQSLMDARAAAARLEGELDVARRIQMSLLPPENARLAGALEIACHIEPAQEVGGDFYDYVERPDGQVFFSIGDVSGKCTKAVVPREAVGFGNVKFVAMIGAFVGWQAVLVTVLASFGIVALLRRFFSASKIPFSPFLAAGAMLFVLFRFI